ncbi:major capsid protein [Gammaproteobacteria bacterium AS21]
MSTPLDTSTLLGLRQELPKFTPFFLTMFFPDVIEFPTEKIEFDRIKKNKKLAPFVAPMVAGKANKAQGGLTTSLTPAYVKPMDIVNPGRLLRRMPGEPLNGQLSPAQRRLATIVDLLDEQDQQITRREEWMAVQAVLHGKVIVEGDDYETQEVDFNRDAKNNIALTLDDRWSQQDAEYDPADDLEDWAEKSSAVVSDLIFSKKAWRLFRKFKAVKIERDADQKGSTTELQMGPQVAKDVQYKGTYGEYRCYVYAGKYDDVKGEEQSFMPGTTLLMAPEGYDGVRCYGAIQDAKANAEGISATSRHPKNWFTDNPSVENMMTQSAPLMVTMSPNDFVVIELD